MFCFPCNFGQTAGSAFHFSRLLQTVPVSRPFVSGLFGEVIHRTDYFHFRFPHRFLDARHRFFNLFGSVESDAASIDFQQLCLRLRILFVVLDNFLS